MMEVTRIACDDEVMQRRWFEVAALADADHRMLPVTTTFAELQPRLADCAEPWQLFAALSGEAIIGTAEAITPTLDNRALLHSSIRVLPERRGTGVGSALLRAVTHYATESGRTVLAGEVVEPLAVAVGGTPGGRFAASHGFQIGLVESHNVIDLPVDETCLAEWGTRPRDEPYVLVDIGDRCPDAYAESYCRTQTEFLALAPAGDLTLEREAWTVARLRDAERRRRRQGRTQFGVLALGAGGEVVGYTQAFVSAPDRPASQADTVVLTAHRGHGLALSMKARNLARLQRQFPQVPYIGTWNADVNAAMRAVNQRMGATPRQRLLGVQRSLQPGG